MESSEEEEQRRRYESIEEQSGRHLGERREPIRRIRRGLKFEAEHMVDSR